MQGRFVPAIEPGGVDVALERPIDPNGLAAPVQDTRTKGAVLAGGEYAKAAIVAMPLRIGGPAGGDAGGASQGPQTIQRRPARARLFAFCGHIGAIGGNAHYRCSASGQGARPAEFSAPAATVMEQIFSKCVRDP